MSLPFSLLGWIDGTFLDDDGVPVAGGFVQFLEAGTSNDKDTYFSSDIVNPIVNQNPVPLDSSGRASIFLEAGGYSAVIWGPNPNNPGTFDSNVCEQLRTISDFEDIGLTYLSTLGQQAAEGARDVTSGYTVLVSDNTITVDSTGGADPCLIILPAVADRGQDITVVNLGTVVLNVVPDGAETINFVAAAYEIAVSASPVLSLATFRPDVTSGSNWLVVAEIIA
jgi:hypothetical protein